MNHHEKFDFLIWKYSIDDSDTETLVSSVVKNTTTSLFGLERRAVSTDYFWLEGVWQCIARASIFYFFVY